MNLPYVYDYTGQHAVTFTVGGTARNTWTDWGLIPSSRHSEPVNGVWSNPATIPGVNGQEDLVRKYPYNAVNSYSKLRSALRNDNRAQFQSDDGYDIYQAASGSLGFIIADQTESFFAKQQEITNFLHGKTGTMVFADDPGKVYTVLLSVESFNNGDSFSSLMISYSVLSET